MYDLRKFAQYLQEKRDTALALIQDGTLTIDEAAKSYTGAMLKWFFEEEGRPESAIDRDGVYRQCLHDLESRLPGYKGIVLGRHM